MLARLYHTVLSAFVDQGATPHYTELARRLGVPLEDTRRALHRLASLGLPIWVHPGTDLLAACAPFSNLPTQYLVSVDGERRWYGQCGLESLAISWLFPGREVRIEAACLDCGGPPPCGCATGRCWRPTRRRPSATSTCRFGIGGTTGRQPEGR